MRPILEILATVAMIRSKAVKAMNANFQIVLTGTGRSALPERLD